VSGACSNLRRDIDAVSPDEESESEGEIEDVVEGTAGEIIRGEKGAEVIRRLADPRKPSDKEVELHGLTHLLCRNWCPVCVPAKGKDLDHRKDVKEGRCSPEFSFDYCFLGDDFLCRLTILVGRERVTGMTCATVVP
jgi:hypothetical protein